MTGTNTACIIYLLALMFSQILSIALIGTVARNGSHQPYRNTYNRHGQHAPPPHPAPEPAGATGNGYLYSSRSACIKEKLGLLSVLVAVTV